MGGYKGFGVGVSYILLLPFSLSGTLHTLVYVFFAFPILASARNLLCLLILLLVYLGAPIGAMGFCWYVKYIQARSIIWLELRVKESCCLVQRETLI